VDVYRLRFGKFFKYDATGDISQNPALSKLTEPQLEAAEQAMPGIAGLILSYAAGDPDAHHKIEAMLACTPEPTNSTRH
jgi:hypothetical protein